MDEPPPAHTLSVCGYEEGEPRSESGSPDVLMPLAVGNCWAYLILSTDYVDTFATRITLETEVTVEGHRHPAYGGYSKSEQTPVPPDRRLVGNGADGLYFRGGIAPDDTLAINWLEYKYPGAAGDAWPIPVEIYLPVYPGAGGGFVIVDTLARTLVAVDEPIETPAGTFRCYVYKHTEGLHDDVSGHWNVYEYFALGIGLVARLTRDQRPGEPEEPEPRFGKLLLEYLFR